MSLYGSFRGVDYANDQVSLTFTSSRTGGVHQPETSDSRPFVQLREFGGIRICGSLCGIHFHKYKDKKQNLENVAHCLCCQNVLSAGDFRLVLIRTETQKHKVCVCFTLSPL